MNYSVTGEQLTGIADAIRVKVGSSDQLEFPDDFVETIGEIPVWTEKTKTGLLPSGSTSVSIPAKNAVSIGYIETANSVKAIKSVERTGVSSPLVFLYNLTTSTSPQRVNCYIYNSGNSTLSVVPSSMNVTVTYYT